jgi:Tol biopolymer transport system component
MKSSATVISLAAVVLVASACGGDGEPNGGGSDEVELTRERCEKLLNIYPGNIMAFDDELTDEEKQKCEGLLFSSPLPAAHPSPTSLPGVPARGKIAFAALRDGGRDIYVVNADGSGQTKLTDDPTDDRDPAWSPDSSQIAFHRYRGEYWGPEHTIYVMNADGSEQTMLTGTYSGGLGLMWSPDGKRIAFTAGPYDDHDVHVMNVDGSGLTRLTTNGAGSPAWSPDGTRIAFKSSRDGNWEIYVMNADGGGEINISGNLPPDSNPAWSPDGSRIAFQSRRGPHAWDIYVVNADGTDPARLTHAPDSHSQPSWSPDGNRIAFMSTSTRYYSAGETWRGHALWVMNADGSGRTRLTDETFRVWSFSWSPVP